MPFWCPIDLCPALAFTSRNAYEKHLQTDHNVPGRETKTFCDWKGNRHLILGDLYRNSKRHYLIEFEAAISDYMPETGRFKHENWQTGKGLRRRQYWCAFSGQPTPTVSETDRQRALKGSGYVQMGSTCPFFILAKEVKDGQVEADILDRHLKHDDLSIGFRRMPDTVKDKIENKLKESVPHTTIVSTVNKFIRDELHDMEYVLSRQDVYNIAMKMFPRQKESVESLREFLEQDNLCIYYELGETLSQVFIILTNETLKSALHDLGKRTVMIDGTHKTNAYGLTLTTVQVLKGNDQHLNVAFCISPNEDTKTFKKFFTRIVPDGLITDVFMSDMYDAYYNAWCEIAGNPILRRICEWHLYRAWEKQAQIKIGKGGEKYFHKIKEIQRNMDELTFFGEFLPFVESLESDVKTVEYGKYIRQRYIAQYPPELWARCFVNNSSPTRNMHLENWHKQLKHGQDQHGVVMLRLDRLIGVNLANSLDAAADRYAHEIIKNPWNARKSNLSKLHNTEAGEFFQHSDKCWSSKQTPDIVVEYTGPCATYIACLKCPKCYLCPHMLTCTCGKYKLDRQCVHTHQVMVTYNISVPQVTDQDRRMELKKRQILRPTALNKLIAIDVNCPIVVEEMEEEADNLIEEVVVEEIFEDANGRLEPEDHLIEEVVEEEMFEDANGRLEPEDHLIEEVVEPSNEEEIVRLIKLVMPEEPLLSPMLLRILKMEPARRHTLIKTILNSPEIPERKIPGNKKAVKQSYFKNKAI